jgi:uncharacterized protein YfaS (alpha-2-macroglobulin family)
VLLSTDKPTYQPGQTVHVRALAREATANVPPEGKELSFTVLDAKGNKVGRKLARVDRFGVASFDFPLADEILLGTWKVQAAAGAPTAWTSRGALHVCPSRGEADLEKPGTGPARSFRALETRYFFGKPAGTPRSR